MAAPTSNCLRLHNFLNKEVFSLKYDAKDHMEQLEKAKQHKNASPTDIARIDSCIDQLQNVVTDLELAATNKDYIQIVKLIGRHQFLLGVALSIIAKSKNILT